MQAGGCLVLKLIRRLEIGKRSNKTVFGMNQLLPKWPHMAVLGMRPECFPRSEDADLKGFGEEEALHMSIARIEGGFLGWSYLDSRSSKNRGKKLL